MLTDQDVRHVNMLIDNMIMAHVKTAHSDSAIFGGIAQEMIDKLNADMDEAALDRQGAADTPGNTQAENRETE